MFQTTLQGFVKKRGPTGKEEEGTKKRKVRKETLETEDQEVTPEKVVVNPTLILDGTGVTLSEEQVSVIQNALDGHHVFFTGSAGVGKSLTLRALIEELKKHHGADRVYVTASTGIAGCNIGGTTLHSFAGVGLGHGTIDSILNKVRKRGDALKRWRACKVLIIDEISMIDPAFFATLEEVARRIRKSRHVFGNIQLILAGDFLQLPYVNKDRRSEAQPLLFQQQLWRLLFGKQPTLELHGSGNGARDSLPSNLLIGRAGVMIHLTRVFRQTNREFVEMLQAIRMGRPTIEHIRILQSRVGAKLDCSDGIRPTRLYPHRFDVKEENATELAKLPGSIQPFTAIDQGEPTYLEELDKHCQAPKTLELKEEAQVVLLRNLDFTRGLVNGSRGVIVGFSQRDKKESALVGELLPLVRFSHDIVEPIDLAEWTIEVGGEIKATRKQIPLALCWASSIHKAQGMTLDKVETKLASVFDCGQLYTALSRVTSLEGLSLIDFNPNRIIYDTRVVEFYRAIS